MFKTQVRRVEGDFYPTPLTVLETIDPHINWGKVDSVIEPCSGDGAILDFIAHRRLSVSSCELSMGSDYLKTPMPSSSLVFTNPPFSLASQFLAKSLTEADCVVFLLRCNFLGSQGRKEFLSANRPTHMYVLSTRPSFVDVCDRCKVTFQKKLLVKKCHICHRNVKPGTDSTEYAWFCWDKVGIMNDPPGIYIL